MKQVDKDNITNKMSIERKAAAYDEALKAAIIAHKDEDKHLKATLERIFPELKESEDEKARKALISVLKSDFENDNTIYDISVGDIISWLEKQGESNETKARMFLINKGYPIDTNGTFPTYEEMYNIIKDGLKKQGEQKSADKAEPKFKVGDWIITNKKHIWYVDETPETTSYLYRLINQYGKVEVAEFEVVDKKARLWTIQDAKDGDVLVCEGKHGQEIGIVKKYVGKYGGCDKCFETYCFVDWDDIFRVGEYMGSRNIHPATKEQRETLMKAMADDGYTFDFEKKELKKINSQVLSSSSNIGKNVLAEWSEDRSKELSLSLQIQAYLSTARDELYAKGKPLYSEKRIEDINKCMLMWTKLHNAYFYPKPTDWSEEDERLFQIIIDILDRENHLGRISHTDLIACVRKLKSFKLQSTWKPSDEQMKELHNVFNDISGGWEDSVLESLYQDLKKLREE